MLVVRHPTGTPGTLQVGRRGRIVLRGSRFRKPLFGFDLRLEHRLLPVVTHGLHRHVLQRRVELPHRDRAALSTAAPTAAGPRYAAEEGQQE